jgi:hypothetical protein
MSESDIRESIGFLRAQATAAHSRLDKLEVGIREDLQTLIVKIDELSAYMNRGKGWAAAALLVSGLAGGVAFKLAEHFIK